MAKVDPYRLDPRFEVAVVLSAVRRPKFYGTIGHAVEPEALGEETHRLIYKAVKAIAKDIGHAPSSDATVLQRIRRWVEEGSVSTEDLNSAIDFFIDAPRKIQPEDELVGELRPLLQRRLEAEAVRAAMEEYSRKGDFSIVQRILAQSKSVGRVDTNTGLRLGTGVFAEIDQLAAMQRLPLGIEELDFALDGGLPLGCQFVYVGGAGAGKSMMLAHVVAHALTLGLSAVVATLELNRVVWMARVMANLTGEPINNILRQDYEETRRKIEKMYPVLGTLIVKDFPAKLTTMPELMQWYDACTEEEGHAAHLFVVDYADKCRSHLREDQNDYSGQNTVYETHRLFVAERRIWGATASQPRRKAAQEKRRRIELDDLADSQGKARVADLVVTGTKSQDGDMIDYLIAKNRYGKADISVGPLPHDWACGRMVAGPE